MVESADGTRIGFARVGDGPIAVVIVHGVLNTAESWLPVAEALAEDCTCYVMDRRGRGRSDAGEDYSFEREIEDIEAVLSVAGPGACLVGHSSGAIYALEAARRLPISCLVLYEPPLHYSGFDRVLDEIRVLVGEGNLDDAAAVFFAREAGLSQSEIASLRATRFWPQIAELAPTLVREWDAIFAFGPSVERYQGLSMPTLLLSGSESMGNPSFATADLERSLADVRRARLDGQGHDANVTAPKVVAGHIANFLCDTADWGAFVVTERS